MEYLNNPKAISSKRTNPNRGTIQHQGLIVIPIFNYFLFSALLWKNLADIVEYNPELINSPEFLSSLGMEQGDDPSAYNFDVAMKRANILSQYKEIPEYRLQPQVWLHGLALESFR